MSNNKKRLLFLGMASLVVLSLGACREGEQGRMLSFEPGKFLGKNPDKALSESQSADLRLRAKFQSGSNMPTGGGKKVATSSMGSAQMQKLRQRAQSQSGSTF